MFFFHLNCFYHLSVTFFSFTNEERRKGKKEETARLAKRGLIGAVTRFLPGKSTKDKKTSHSKYNLV